MRSSYNVIKGDYVRSNTVYTIKAPLVPVKVEPPQKEEIEDVIDIEEVKRNAEDIIKKALDKHEKILSEAQQEAEKIKREAYDAAYKKGYEDGMKKGRDEGIKSTEGLRKEALDVLKEAHKVSRNYIEDQKSEIVNLALSIAQKIIGYEADKNDSIISKIARDAIGAAVVKGQIIIRVNPMDYAILDCKRDELSKAAGENTIINIIKDGSIVRGGCRVESEDSFVDADIDTQLDKIKEALMGR